MSPKLLLGNVEQTENCFMGLGQVISELFNDPGGLDEFVCGDVLEDVHGL